MNIMLPVYLFALTAIGVNGQPEQAVVLSTETGDIAGTLLVPDTDGPVPVALLIAGSGPTDRDGNNPMMTNNSLKMLAEGLYEYGIASLRYDKRGIGESRQAGLKERDLRFETYIEDARAWVALLDEREELGEVIVIGHSEGSLIGMAAARDERVDKFVSIAGAGEPAHAVLRRQLTTQAPGIVNVFTPILDSLIQGDTVREVPAYLNTLFRPSVQPYLISWFAYDPAQLIGQLEKPMLIVQGTTDIQVEEADARKLAEANERAELFLVEGMNHILKDAPADRQQNLETYNDPDLPLSAGLVERIAGFIRRP